MNDHSVAGTSTASTSSRISAEDAEEYTRAVGQVMSGGWRLCAAAHRLGVPEAMGMTSREWVREIGGAVRLGLDERREAVKELTDPEGEFNFSQREAADVLGIGTMTVNRDLRGVPDGTAETSAVQEDAEADVPDGTPEEFADCGDCGEPHDDDEPCPEIVVYPPDLGGPPTVGDVRAEISGAFDDEAVGAEMAAAKHVADMARVRATWARFMGDRPPGVLAEGLERDELHRLLRDLDGFILWLEQARGCAAAATRPRRVG